jgi:signal transduction histidine kinase
MLDEGNPEWLSRLGEKVDRFSWWLQEARETARVEEERQILDQLENVHRQYARLREDAVRLYDEGQRDKAREKLLSDVSQKYEEAYALCEEFLRTNTQLVEATSARVRQQVGQVTLIVSITGATTFGLGLVLLGLFFRGVLAPLRRLSADARLATGAVRNPSSHPVRDEFSELGRYFQILMTDVAETRSNLRQSRSQLANAEKLAAVGRLAASVAHEIRNPLTAMKMWLYSLRRSSSFDDQTLEKLNVVSSEMARLERIVRQFLEFSRPAQLTTGRVAVTKLLDETLDLQKYLLQQRGIDVMRSYAADLPEICGDAEQLKQVFVNLINNAIEAMPGGGQLRVSASDCQRGDRRMVLVSIADSGSGIPPDVQQRLFEPFFTTKPEGTGLGLCIAAGIIVRHGGILSLGSSTARGTEWEIWIPVGTSTQPRQSAAAEALGATHVGEPLRWEES